MSKLFATMIKRFNARQRTRILGFGSSNTAHFLPGMHWFECFDLAIHTRYGRIHTCINTGISGNTTRNLLARFEEDAALYQPHLTFITVGGNDCNPVKLIDAEEFEGNLRELHRRFTTINCAVVFQTYYAPNPELVDAQRLTIFYQYMDIVRKVARATKSGLIDHLSRWEYLRRQYPAIYIQLMHDGFHINHRGNKVMGVDIARCFDAALTNQNLEHWGEALCVQRLMDGTPDS